MNYDNWKLETPEELTNECGFCGNAIEDHKQYCSRECYVADNDENC